MELLYHYCSVEAFLAIIQSRVVRLSDASQMNDSHELIWGDRIVQELFDSKKQEVGDEEMHQAKLGYDINHSRAFVFCLSTEPDILSQWRAYADDGTGVAIGFSKAAFPQHSHLLLSNVMPNENSALRQVIYSEAEQRSLINAVYESALAQLRTDSAAVRGSEGKFSPSNFQVVGASLRGVAPVLKNPKFEEEREWRLIHTPFFGHLGNVGLGFHGTSYKSGQRVSNRRIVTYFEHPIYDDAISEVWIGPRSSMEGADVSLALALNGYSRATVIRSAATYRR